MGTRNDPFPRNPDGSKRLEYKIETIRKVQVDSLDVMHQSNNPTSHEVEHFGVTISKERFCKLVCQPGTRKGGEDADSSTTWILEDGRLIASVFLSPSSRASWYGSLYAYYISREDEAEIYDATRQPTRWERIWALRCVIAKFSTKELDELEGVIVERLMYADNPTQNLEKSVLDRLHKALATGKE